MVLFCFHFFSTNKNNLRKNIWIHLDEVPNRTANLTTFWGKVWFYLCLNICTVKENITDNELPPKKLVGSLFLPSSMYVNVNVSIRKKKNYTAEWRTCFSMSVVCPPVFCFLLLLLMMRVAWGQKGSGRSPSATFIYIYDLLFIILSFKVTSSGCTEEEIKTRFDNLSHFFLQDKTLQRKSNNFIASYCLEGKFVLSFLKNWQWSD